MNLAEIFETEPKQWGMRGDPYFWRFLKEKAREVPITISETELESWIKKKHLEFSGKELTDDMIPLLVCRLRSNEAKERWGKTEAFAEYSVKTESRPEEEINAGFNEIFASFSECLTAGLNYDSKETQAQVKKLQDYITENFYTCTKEILAGLGHMYAADERFRKNIDKRAEGTADYVEKAIIHHVHTGD